jgi:Thymidylate kinase
VTLHVAVLGIDGSGKSTLARALPMVMAAEMNVVAGAAGDEFSVFGPDQDHLAPKFHPKGLPVAARLAHLFRGLAKRFAGRPSYPYLKLSHLMFQDDAAASIARRYGCDVMVSDCNLILSAMGRAGNYQDANRERSTTDDLRAVFSFLIEGEALPEASARRLPSLSAAGTVCGVARTLGFDGVRIPDVVLFLDVDPEVAMDRIRARGEPVDPHENLADMQHARETYLKALRAMEMHRGDTCTHVIDAGDLEPNEVIAAAIAALRPHINSLRDTGTGSVLGTTAGGGRSVLNAGYLLRYLGGRWFQGAWREPAFLFSSMGRQLLREGYSAGVMRVIYDRGGVHRSIADRVFLNYPLHRAVYDRLQILSAGIESELESRLEHAPRVRIFTAPSGFAYDLFMPLSAIAARRPELMSKVELVAADLDPHAVLRDELEQRAAELGLGAFRFAVGDMTTSEFQRDVAQDGPFDMALFVGLSSWLPRPHALRHLRWLRAILQGDGVLVSDCFSADTYSLGGRYIGYRAQYYSPALYRSLLDYAGFDGAATSIESGRDRINHVLITRPKTEIRVAA